MSNEEVYARFANAEKEWESGELYVKVYGYKRSRVKRVLLRVRGTAVILERGEIGTLITMLEEVRKLIP